MNENVKKMARDLCECYVDHDATFDAEATAEKMVAKGYQKRVDGKWMSNDFLHEEENEKDDWKNYACSSCGYRTEAYYRNTRDMGYKFCPNCGAKMKGDLDEN